MHFREVVEDLMLVCRVVNRDAGSSFLVRACAGLCHGKGRQLRSGRSASSRTSIMQSTTMSTQVNLPYSHSVVPVFVIIIFATESAYSIDSFEIKHPILL